MGYIFSLQPSVQFQYFIQTKNIEKALVLIKTDDYKVTILFLFHKSSHLTIILASVEPLHHMVWVQRIRKEMRHPLESKLIIDNINHLCQSAFNLFLIFPIFLCNPWTNHFRHVLHTGSMITQIIIMTQVPCVEIHCTVIHCLTLSCIHNLINQSVSNFSDISLQSLNKPFHACNSYWCHDYKDTNNYNDTSPLCRNSLYSDFLILHWVVFITTLYFCYQWPYMCFPSILSLKDQGGFWKSGK